MKPDKIKHFLVIYDLTTGSVAVKRFGNDYDAEQESRVKDDNLDIVLLGADSLETIKQTHSSYFNGRGQQLEELLPS
jgi:hypothetical protein